MNDADFQRWADKGHFTDWTRKPGRIGLVRERAIMFCRLIPPTGSWSSSDLNHAMFEGINPHARNYLASALQFLRRKKLVDGCWRYGPANAKTFGRPSIRWINPTAGRAGLEDML